MIWFDDTEKNEEQATRGGCNGMTDIEADLMLAKARAVMLEAERDVLQKRVNDLEAENKNYERTRVSLTKRLRHLLQSKFISRYDETDGEGKYVRDIGELDEWIAELEALARAADDDAADSYTAPALIPLYICDRRKCENCNPECTRTDDLRHAKHFEIFGCGGHILEMEE